MSPDQGVQAPVSTAPTPRADVDDTSTEPRTAEDSWVALTEWFLIVASLVFLVAYAIPIIWPGVSHAVHRDCNVVTYFVWAAFGVDYVARLILHANRIEFLRTHVFDLCVLVLPMLRPMRLLRLVALLSVMNRVGAHSVRGRVVTYATSSALLLLVVASLAITDAERGQPGATIKNVGDGLWWSITTMTTVGYGDHYPVTVTGKVIATALLLSGITLLGIVTGTFASWIADMVAESTEAQDETREIVETLVTEVRSLRDEIAELRAGRAPGGAGQSPFDGAG